MAQNGGREEWCLGLEYWLDFHLVFSCLITLSVEHCAKSMKTWLLWPCVFQTKRSVFFNQTKARADTKGVQFVYCIHILFIPLDLLSILLCLSLCTRCLNFHGFHLNSVNNGLLKDREDACFFPLFLTIQSAVWQLLNSP